MSLKAWEQDLRLLLFMISAIASFNKAIAVSDSSSLEKKLSYNYLLGCYFQFDKNLLENLNNHSVWGPL